MNAGERTHAVPMLEESYQAALNAPDVGVGADEPAVLGAVLERGVRFARSGLSHLLPAGAGEIVHHPDLLALADDTVVLMAMIPVLRYRGMRTVRERRELEELVDALEATHAVMRSKPIGLNAERDRLAAELRQRLQPPKPVAPETPASAPDAAPAEEPGLLEKVRDSLRRWLPGSQNGEPELEIVPEIELEPDRPRKTTKSLDIFAGYFANLVERTPAIRAADAVWQEIAQIAAEKEWPEAEAPLILFCQGLAATEFAATVHEWRSATAPELRDLLERRQNLIDSEYTGLNYQTFLLSEDRRILGYKKIGFEFDMEAMEYHTGYVERQIAELRAKLGKLSTDSATD